MRVTGLVQYCNGAPVLALFLNSRKAEKSVEFTRLRSRLNGVMPVKFFPVCRLATEVTLWLIAAGPQYYFALRKLPLKVFCLSLGLFPSLSQYLFF